MTTEELRAALHDARHLPNGRGKAERLETLAEAARAGTDRSLETEILLALVTSYEYGGERDRMPVAFGRILRIYDEFPGELDGHAHDIHWYLKWMTNALLSNPAVPLTTAEKWLTELTSRYGQRGYSQRPVLAFHALIARYRDDRTAAEAHQEASIAAERDTMADCDACERNGWGSLLDAFGDDEGALRHWEPVLSGERRCAEEPHRVLAKALLPLLRTGRIEEARSAFLRGYPLVRHRPGLRPSVGFHLEFCALTGNEARGLEILADHAAWLDERSVDTGQRIGFLSGVAVLLRRLLALGHGDVPVGETTVAELAPRVEAEVAELAALYDTRGGNPSYGNRVAARLAASPLLERLSLGPVAGRLP
ncbi:hypothetical protein, partial [Actinocorallia lasiicapitis]